MNLIEGNIEGLQKDIEDIPQVRLPKIFPRNSSWVRTDGSGPRGGDFQDHAEAELRRAVLEEVDKDDGIGCGEGYKFPPFRLLCDQFLLKFPIL